MTKVFSVARDAFGNAIPEAQVTVFDAGTETKRNIFEDSALSLAKQNPFTSQADGFFEFFTEAGEIKIKLTKSGLPDSEVDFIPVSLVDFGTLQQGAQISYSGADLVILSGVSTQIPFNTVVYDDGGLTVAVGLLTCQQNGMYAVNAQYQINNATTSTVVTNTLTVSGSFSIGGETDSIQTTTDQDERISGIWRASVGDTLQLDVLPLGGGQLDIFGSGSLPKLTAGLLYPFG